VRQAEVCNGLQRIVEAVPGLAGEADDEVGGDILEAGFLGELDSGDGLRGGVNPPDALEFGVREGLDAEGESVKAEGLAVRRNSGEADSGLTSRVDSRRERGFVLGNPSPESSPSRGEEQ
jgi:hypothetical protein